MSNSNLPQKQNTNVAAITNAVNIMNARNLALTDSQYAARITRLTPTAIIILIDQSGSMIEEIIDELGVSVSKSELVSKVINEFLYELINVCQKDYGVRDYFDVSVIGYGTDDEQANYAWEGKLEGKEFVTISELKDGILNTLESIVSETNRFGKIVDKKITRRVWITPQANGLTPMKNAFELAKTNLEKWVLKNENSFPPLLINITDGEASDVDDFEELIDLCDEIKKINTSDGGVLIYNYHMSNNNDNEIIFPKCSDDIGEDEYTIALSKMSSFIPKTISNIAAKEFNRPDIIKEDTFGLIVNSTSINSLIKLFKIGTTGQINNLQ